MSSIRSGSSKPENPNTGRTKQNRNWQTCILTPFTLSILLAAIFLPENGSTSDVSNRSDDFKTHPTIGNALITDDMEKRSAAPKMEANGGRKYYHQLPRNVIPTKYDLLFRSNIPIEGITLKKEKEHSFEGTVDIDLGVKEKSAEIQLHAVNLTIHEVKVTSAGKQITVSSFERSKTYPDRIVIKLASPLKKGSQTALRLKYSGTIGRTSKGYFYGNLQEGFSYHLTSEGFATLWRNGPQFAVRLRPLYHFRKLNNPFYTATMNEPDGARLMVPCFDEPALKAVWVVTMEYPQGYTALANQKQVNSAKLNDGFERATFLPTPPMSSFLLALSVNQHTRLCKTATRNVEVCLYSLTVSSAEGERVLDVAVKSLNYLVNSTGVPYGLEKLDIFVSELYFQGAFECWGLVMTNGLKTNTMVHEVAHQWFGNLATIGTWGDIWLSEGLTTYLECLIQDKLGFDKFCFADYKQEALKSEDHAIVFKYDSDIPVVNAGKPGESVYFDYVVYKKAGVMMKLFADAYTEDWTRDVMKKFVHKFQKKNAITEDLLDIVERMSTNSKYEVAPVEFLKDWLYQVGYPVLLVSRLNETHISVDQTPLIKGNKELKSNSWNVPVLYQIGRETQMKWLHKNDILEIELPVKSIINIDPKNDAPYYVLYAENVENNYSGYENDYMCNGIENTPVNQNYCKGMKGAKEQTIKSK